MSDLQPGRLDGHGSTERQPSMNNSTKQSIFTSRQSFPRRHVSPARAAQAALGTKPRTFSPFRRQSTPGYTEPHIVAAAASEAAQAVHTPSHARVFVRDFDKSRANGSLHSNSPNRASIWVSLVHGEKRQRSGSPLGRARAASVDLTKTPSPRSEFPPPAILASGLGRKRGPADTRLGGGRCLKSEPAQREAKRPRLRPRLYYSLDGLNFPGVTGFQPSLQPPSPLFFSNSPRPRPQLPPRFSSSEAAARMLSKTRAEDPHVKTVSLARGTISSTPSYGSTSVPSPGGRKNVDRVSLDRSNRDKVRSNSPDESRSTSRQGSMGANVSTHLNSIGIIELLDQDDRPTFIVDIADRTNYGPGQLHLVFSNSSLKSCYGLTDLVSGHSVENASPGPTTWPQFKSWLLGASVNGESLDVCLPAFTYAGVLWNCSTLRKRLRIVSGAFTSTSPGQSSNAQSVPSAPLGTTVEASNVLSAGGTTSEALVQEPSDYFGIAAPPEPKKAPLTELLVPIIESISPNISTANSGLTADSGFQMSNGNVLATTPNPFSTSIDLFPSPSMYVNFSQALEASMFPLPSSSDIDSVYSQSPVMTSDSPSFDWTRLPVTDAMPPHIQFARSVDWASTSLGPIETWSSDLRQMCNLIMASPHPAAIYWGEDLIAIYNEAYILLAGQKHPKLMGHGYAVIWSEIWDDVKDVFASARLTGEATMKDDDCLFMLRNGYLEETYFSWSIIPMVGGDGSVMGLYNPAFEKTRRKIAERRMLTLREVGERTASARDVRAFWVEVMEAWRFNEYDSPFLLLYSVTDEHDSDASSIQSGSVFAPRHCSLEGSLGVPEGHPSAPEQIDLKAGMEGFGPVFREVMKTDKPVLLEVGSKDLPAELLSGMEWRGFGDPVRAVVVCPIHPTTGESVLGFLVLGVNPRRPYDDDYSLFVQLLSRQLATSLASVVLFEEEIRRGQKAAKLAALDRIELSEQLAARTQEAIESETKFTRMAEFAPVGMFIAGTDGRITFANDTWYDISRVPRNNAMADTWMESVLPNDLGLVKRLWSDLVERTKPVSSEFRFKAQWEDRNGNRGDTWVLFSAYPEKYEDGRLKVIFGSITNISQQKWAEGIQTRKMEEAVELKRQQENFIDITSHEMRNPLSAILQCSDEIASSLTQFQQQQHHGEKGIALTDTVVASCLDAAQTITLCSQHQKRIVDDILTLSKLDSQLLLVTPVDAQPLTVVQRALKMHEGELQAADIQMKFVVDKSFREMNLDWVRFDPSRVLQVLINLTTNAIKFTTTETKRTITVIIAAAEQRPSEMEHPPVKYFPTRNTRSDQLEQPDWGHGEKVYIHFSVADTGRGLSPEEKKLLFLRFSQASPRTHVQYGGSGLGLFISRELTELQGGEIGVESEAGKGSTFAFYVAARRSAAPPEAEAGMPGYGRPAAALEAGERSTLGVPGKGDEGAEIGATAAKSVRAAARVRKVLIVEDNVVNQRVLQKQLKNMGTEVHLANHGGEALDKLRQSTYWADDSAGQNGKRIELGVVLMDQEMPVMDGLTCTRKIRELEKEGKVTGHIPIIAVTANARSEQVQTALEAGMDDVMSKPFRIPDLMPKIEELLERYPMPSAE